MQPKKDERQSNKPFRFDGFSTPQYTQVPDQLFDELLSLLTGAELKVLLYICRRTFGFKKESDNISLNQMLKGIRKRDGTRLDSGTGLSKPTLLRALKGLKDKHIIVAERRNDLVAGSLATNYKLRIKGTPGKEMNQGEVQNFATPPGSDFDHQQETVNQHTETALAATLMDFGIDKPTVDRLVKNHDGSLISQKIDYVTFMQQEQPNLVRNPRGWLLKAIEYDFGPPAGYRPRAEREMLQARAEKRQKEAEDREAKRRLATEETISQHQTVQESIIAAAQEAYQTTAAEGKLWQEVLHHLRLLTSDVTYALIRDAQLLTTNDGTAIIGTVNPLSVRWLRNHLGTDLPTIFERCGQPVEAIQVLHLTPKEQ